MKMGSMKMENGVTENGVSHHCGTYTYAETNFANPHAATAINGVTYRYDRNGNMASTSAGHLNTWNYRNRLTASQGGGTATTSYLYDVDDQRVKKVSGATTTYYIGNTYERTGATSTKYVYAGDSLVTTIEGGGMATSTYHHHLDHLGSTRVTSDELTEVVQSIDYYPFGEKRIETGNDHSSREYIGEFYDSETSLSYLNWRYLESTSGQFLSQDPVFWEVGQTQDGNTALINPQLQNSYSYAGNNPINYKDPSGRFLPVLAYFAVDSAATLLQVYGAGQIVKHTAEFFLSADKTRPAGDLAFDFAGEAATYFMTPIGRVMFDTTNLAIDLIDEAYGDTIRSGVNRLRSNQNSSQPSNQPAPNTNQLLPPSAPASSRPAVPSPQAPAAAPATNPKTNAPAKSSSYDTAYKTLLAASVAINNKDYKAASKYLKQASKSLPK
jgi:RHS repeat-associated protein